MAKVYANLCEKGAINYNKVPENLKKQVREIIENDGFTINPDGSVVMK